MKYSSVLFDLDGTLIDSKESIRKSFEYTLKKMKYKETKVMDVNRLIGPPILQSFQSVYGFSLKESKKAYAYYLEEYVDNGQMYTADIYEGVKEILKKLNALEIFIGVATTKNQINAQKILSRLLPEEIKTAQVYGTKNDGSRSEKKQVIFDLLNDHKITDFSKVLMIGDRHYDIEGAKSLGIDSVGVIYGCGSEEELRNAGATYILSKIKALLNLI